MKVRNGFVSNSSSSSFVIVLPENFVKNFDYTEILKENEDFPLEEFKTLIKSFESRGLYAEEIYDVGNEIDEDFEYGSLFYDIIYDAVEPYIIASVETGPDSGEQFVVVKREKIENILKTIL